MNGGVPHWQRWDVPKQSVQVSGDPKQGGKLHPSVEDNNRNAKPIRTSSTDRFIP